MPESQTPFGDPPLLPRSRNKSKSPGSPATPKTKQSVPSKPAESTPPANEAKSIPSMKIFIETECDEIKKFLLEKNASYGNSAADPVRIFSKADPVEQINVRIDDKLSRLIRGHEYPGDNDELDLIGYFILKRVVKRIHLSG